MKMNRFDLEESIGDCWKITDDLDLCREELEFNDTQDNVILGLISLYNLRFNRLFKTMEELIKNGELK